MGRTTHQTASKLIALAFDDPYKADEARAALHRMEGEGLLDLDETAVVVRRASGKIRITQDIDVVSKGQHVGHLAGLIAGAITGTMPLILAGTLAGRLVGRLLDHGITNHFVTTLGKELTPATSMLIVLARSDSERRRRVAERLREWQPTIHESDLDPELERELTQIIRES